MVVTVDGTNPVAEAGDPQLVKQVNSTVTLDGSASSDNEGAVTYSWALTGDPDTTGSHAE